MSCEKPWPRWDFCLRFWSAPRQTRRLPLARILSFLFQASSLETFDSPQIPTGTSANGPGFTTTFGGGATFTGDGLVTNINVTNAYAQPFFGPSPGAPDTTNYLAVGGNEFSGGTTITFANSHNIFGLYWGSVDTYNTIIFENNGVALAGGTFTGADVSPLLDNWKSGQLDFEWICPVLRLGLIQSSRTAEFDA